MKQKQIILDAELGPDGVWRVTNSEESTERSYGWPRIPTPSIWDEEIYKSIFAVDFASGEASTAQYDPAANEWKLMYDWETTRRLWDEWRRKGWSHVPGS